MSSRNRNRNSQTQGRNQNGQQRQQTGRQQTQARPQGSQDRAFLGADLGYNQDRTVQGAQSRTEGAQARQGQTRGQFAGVGPKSYRRSDDRIREDIYEVLTRHSEIDASDIEVQVKSGEVNLSGMVSDRRQKLLAEHFISQLVGVYEVHNTIRVLRSTDGDTASSRSTTGNVTNNNYSSQPRSTS